MKRVLGFLRLTRPANVVTAVSDVLAGVAISAFLLSSAWDFSDLLWLILSTMGLYGGGVVMNDVFDADLDAVERPERPIPSGLISIGEAATLGLFLLIAGVVFAFLSSALSGLLALAIAIAALVYDKYGKHHAFLGPLNMGICRGLNLLLGISIVPDQVAGYWHLAIIPVLYIAAITMISRGEVHGGSKSTLYGAALLYLVAMTSIGYLAFIRGEVLITGLFILLWAIMILIPLAKAIGKPEGRMIGRAVKAGVLALILMNAAWASAFGFTSLALIIVALLPISILLAKAFAVT